MRFTSRTMLKLTSFLACTTSIWGESIDISSRDCYYLPPLGDIVRVERASASQTNPVAPQQRGQINQNTYDKIQRQPQEIAKAFNEVVARGAAEAKAEHRKIKESSWASEEKTYLADSESFYRFKAKVCRERAEWCSEDGKRDEGSKYSAEARAFEEMANRKCVEQDLAPSKNRIIQAYGEDTLEYWREMLTVLSCQEYWYESQHQKLDILRELQIEAERRHQELQRQAAEQERRRLAEEQERRRLAEEQARRQREQELEQARANAVRRHSYNTVEYWEEMMAFHRGRLNRYSWFSHEYEQENLLLSAARASRDVLHSQAEARRRQAEQQEFRGWWYAPAASNGGLLSELEKEAIRDWVQDHYKNLNDRAKEFNDRVVAQGGDDVEAKKIALMPDPKREGGVYITREMGIAQTLCRPLGGRYSAYRGHRESSPRYLEALRVVFSVDRAQALYDDVIVNLEDNSEDKEEVEVPNQAPEGGAPAAAVGAAQPAVAGQFDQEERARRSAQEESDRELAQRLHQEESASLLAQEERDRAAAQQLRDQDAREEAEGVHVDSNEDDEEAVVQRLRNHTFQEAQNARARIPLRRADQLSEQEVRQLARSWVQPVNSPNSKRQGKTYTTEEYTGVATFMKGKNLTECAMKRVLSEIFTPGRAESLANAIYMGGVEGDENYEDEAEAEAQAVDASPVAQNARRLQSQSQLRPGEAAGSVATHSRRPLASSAYDEAEVE